MIDFGDVTNDGSSNAQDSDSQIIIEWDVITLDYMDNNTLYWVTAGAEYNNGDDIWLGSAAFISLIDDYANVCTRQRRLSALLVFHRRSITERSGCLQQNLFIC